MNRTRIAIVGAGLGGLHAAWLLERQGMTDYVLLEARDVVGGRIETVAPPPSAGTGRFDLGPTWFWPDAQPELDRLVADLGLERFAQPERGAMLLERSPTETPTRMLNHGSTGSMRLADGMGALPHALRRRLDPTRIVTGQAVRHLRRTADGVELGTVTSSGDDSSWHAQQVLLALPPRLASGLSFSPALPATLVAQWRATPTWMAPNAKYLAVYDRPFWRDRGLSGEARSAYGPMIQIHDASSPRGAAALFGFLGVPAHARRGIADDALRAHCRAQLIRLFGAAAGRPKMEVVKDWALDPLTTVEADLAPSPGHAAAPEATPASGPWQGLLAGIASEWSREFPGYLAGAIDAAAQGARWLGIQPLSASSDRWKTP